MLVEATHQEETRVVVVDDDRLEELDVETSTKKQIKGNSYYFLLYSWKSRKSSSEYRNIQGKKLERRKSA